MGQIFVILCVCVYVLDSAVAEWVFSVRGTIMRTDGR